MTFKTIVHGSVAGYNVGCPCDKCAEAKRGSRLLHAFRPVVAVGGMRPACSCGWRTERVQDWQSAANVWRRQHKAALS